MLKWFLLPFVYIKKVKTKSIFYVKLFIMANIIKYIGLFGYGLSTLGYIGRAFQGFPSISILIGMILVTLGYLFVFIDKYQKMNKDKDYNGTSVPSSKKSRKMKLLSLNKYISKLTLGYILLFVFFTLIHIYPQFTFTVRYYDKFAALGYFTLLFQKYVSYKIYFIPAVLLTLYYILGSYQKIIEQDDFIDYLQLISRMLLALYYSESIIA